MDLTKLGVFCFLDGLTDEQVKQFARKVEHLGYSALWFAEVTGRERFILVSYLLSHTERLIVQPTDRVFVAGLQGPPFTLCRTLLENRTTLRGLRLNTFSERSRRRKHVVQT
ncbi:MAG: LLM class flavin-dependent oxidoreductase [Candidatus Binatia bacterium]